MEMYFTGEDRTSGSQQDKSDLVVAVQGVLEGAIVDYPLTYEFSYIFSELTPKIHLNWRLITKDIVHYQRFTSTQYWHSNCGQQK